jgi:tetratricopeptide (TPR) repeat protein
VWKARVVSLGTMLMLCPAAMSAGQDSARPIYYSVPGMDEAIVVRNVVYRRDGQVERFVSESRLNALAYSLMRSNRQAALETLQWVVDIAPLSAGAHDSLAAGYEAIGRPDLALAEARRAIELLDTSPDLSESRKKATRDSADAKIRRLQKE